MFTFRAEDTLFSSLEGGAIVTTQKPVLELKNISKTFADVTVLHDISIDLYPGEVHCLLGENGAGKSTLIKIISGAYRPDNSGNIIYKGNNIKEVTPKWSRENGIITIYQEIDLVPALSAAENISLSNEPLKSGGSIDWAKVNERATEIIQDMGVEIDIRKPVRELKVAHQQMVAIAKALTLESQVIIFDEPTAVFTSSEVKLLFNLIDKLKSRGVAILYISHHLDEIFEIGDRITVLRDGNLVRTGKVKDFDKNSLIKAMVGREIQLSKRHGSESSGEELLKVEGLSHLNVVKDICFSLRQGEIVGVAGLVGAGRTEMARLIVGADRPDKGDIYFKGKKEKIKSPQKALSLGIGMVPESRKEEGIVPGRSMAENMAYSTVEKKARFGIVPWKQIKKLVTELILNLEVRPNQPELHINLLSGGNQQKIVLGKWLAARCDLMILDEPTRGVDVGARNEIYKLMQKLKEEGKSILMISSDMTEILTQSDRILVMAQGRIVGELSCEEATEEKVLSFALQLGGEVKDG